MRDRMRGSFGEARWIIVGVTVLVVYGVSGYTAFGYGIADAIHNTVLVLTTVGFTPEQTPSTGERVFTASIAVFGIVVFLGALALFTTALVEGRIGIASRRRRMERRAGSMTNHFVICAYGRVGRAVARELEAEGVGFVVVDRLEDLEPEMRAAGVTYVLGDPTSEAVLRRTGIEHARGLVSAVDSDADNVYITLTARSLNPGLFIVARAGEAAAADRLYRAGADRVVSPYVSSGRHMALLALRPRVVDYLEIAGRSLRLEELVVERGSALDGARLGLACGRATPLVVRRASGEIVASPDAEMTLAEGDLIVLLGAPTELRTAEGEPAGAGRRRRAAKTKA